MPPIAFQRTVAHWLFEVRYEIESLWTEGRCRILGHKMVPLGRLIYEGCWTADEICERCGRMTWWPQ